MIEEILKFSIGSITISAVVVFISKGIFNTLLSKDIENYKTRLNKELEGHKSELQKSIFEHKTKFSNLHGERANVIKELYKKLTNLETYLKDYYSDITDNQDKLLVGKTLSTLTTSYLDFMEYFNHNRIFFDDNVCFYIEEISAITSIVIGGGYEENDSVHSLVLTSGWNKTVKMLIDDDIPKFKKELENMFKRILEY
ncbi:hypothetical protein RJD24_14600 [Bacillaceae bacterium IKA-2]|nr:hypothetical protein RJD24_14600 [Bacillaceae bacterium IKA-2]